MTPTEDIWEDPAIGYLPQQRGLILGFRAWLRNRSLPLAGYLADLKLASPAISVAAGAMEELEQTIENETPTLKQAHQALVLLGMFVAYANRIGKGPIPQLRLPRLVQKQPNPFADGVAEALKHTHACLEIERAWISSSSKKPPIELVIFSAILHGGLLHQSAIIQLARTLLIAPEEAISLAGNRVSIDLQLPWQGVPGAEHRRWYPDDQTVALIRRPENYQTPEKDLTGLSDDELGRSLLRKIRERIRRCPNAWVPGRWKQLLDTIATAAHAEVPAVLVEYATRRIVSHSLKPETLQRIFSSPAATAPRTDSGDLESDVLDSEDSQTSDEQAIVREPDWLCFLRHAFIEKDSSALQAKLEEQVKPISDASSPGHCITRFALYLLTQRHLEPNRIVRRKPLKPNTVRSLTLTVGKRFGCILGEQNPAELTAENLETLYTQVLESVVEGRDPKRLRGTVASALREFQHFLYLHCDGPSINVREILGSDRGLLPVDSRIITLEQFSEARRILRSDSEHAREWMDADVRHAAEAMLILGFRCGTRRMEAHGLEVDDLTDRSCPWLWIRPTQARQLKTSNAKRQIPLHETLIPKDELDVLYSWKEKRIGWGVSSECPWLFALPDPDANGNTAPRQIPVNKMISLVHRAIRRATGDHTLHFHHLRHSFATWSFFRLMFSDLEQPPALFPNLPETSGWMENSKRFRRELYGTAHPTRRHAMAIASLLGHSGPSVSMEHYIHCMDWLLNAFWSQSKLLRVQSTHCTALASTKSGSSLYERRKTPGADPIPVHLIAAEFPSLKRKPGKAKPGVDSANTADVPYIPWVQKTWDLLFRCSRASDDPLDSIAEELGFEPACAKQILARAVSISNVTATRGARSHIHRMKGSPSSKGNDGESVFGLYPEIPRGTVDQKVIQAWEDQFAKVPRDLLRSVLGYYVTHAWKTLATVIFHDPAAPEDAESYLAFLKELGFEDQQLRLVFFEHEKRKRSALRKQWKTALRINWRWRGTFNYRKPPFGDTAASKRWLGIEPNFGNKLPRASTQGQNGFRFLMVMAAVAFGFAGDEQP